MSATPSVWLSEEGCLALREGGAGQSEAVLGEGGMWPGRKPIAEGQRLNLACPPKEAEAC